MPGKNPPLTPLESQKQLLIAESQINRVQLLQEGQAVAAGVRCVVDRARSYGSFASAAALLAAGIVAFRRRVPVPAAKKTSWLQKILKGARLASSIWLAFRARKRVSSLAADKETRRQRTR